MPLSSPDGYLEFTNAVPRAVKMVATSNVGIGTSSPQYALDVHGTSNTGPLTVSSLTIADGAIVGDVSISGNLALTSNVTTSVDSNVVVEHKGPHGRGAVPLRKYPEIIFEEGKFDANDTTNTYTQAGYTVTVSGFVNSSNHPWKAFNGIDYEVGMLLSGLNYDTNGNANTSGTTASRLSASDSTPYGEWLKLELPNRIKLDRYAFTSRNDPTYWSQSVEAGQVWGSNNDSDWEHLHTFTNSGFTGGSQTASFDVQTDKYYKYYAFIVTKTFAAGSDYYLCLPELKYYGYEELATQGDTSIDTTFTSVMNTPQTTGAQVYVDGNLGETFTNRVTGPTVSNTATTYDSTDKYWELTGALTSNVTLEANTFLEGDAPHSVSVWFNSSNLEANVSNTCVFSISDQEKLDSQNLDLQSNTWHNLTYAYQGEGGSRVTYLDGRKVAEDQAEDTFGDYPPFAMTGYSQGGYVVSASSEYSPSSQAWEAFEPTTTQIWICDEYNSDGTTPRYTGGLTSSGGGVYQGPISTDSIPISGSGSETIRGEYIQIEFPFKFKLEDIAYLREAAFWGYTRLPYSGSIVACNDGINWKTIHNWTGLTDADVGSTDGSNLAVTQSPYRSGIFAVDKDSATYGAYKFFRIICTRIQKTYTEQGDGNSYGLWSIVQLELYGHRENDLVRLPDPTRVLKYPHIAMTGPAQRGYVASASSNYNTYNPWEAFDNNTGGGWISVGGTNYSGGSGAYNKSPGSLLGTNSATSTEIREGEFLQIETPHKITVNHILLSSGSSDGPTDFKFWGSNDGSVWSLLHTETNHTNATSAQVDINSSVAYKYHAIVISKTRRTTQGDYVNVRELELYGTGVDSIPIQIGGGNIDKVANFRVYDKFIGEDQALEIWDAQKDVFREVKSSVTLHKGRLGIGTTEPEGRLAVLDEPDPDAYGLQEFPPKPLVGYKTHIEGHGVYKVSVSGLHQETDIYAGWKAFDDNADGASDAWITYDPSYNNGAQTLNKRLSSNTPLGEYIVLEFPYKVKISLAKLHERSANTSNAPSAGVFYGSNDGVSWTELKSFSGLTYDDGAGVYSDVEINATDYFKKIALVVTNIGSTGSTWMGLGELRYFGYREQVMKQSVLHDGQLTLTKSLTVPRIGPALDTDNTPRRDRLVVEYNTSTNPTFEGAVRDTSGRGNDGILAGSVSYNAMEKALVFDGNGDYIRSGILSNMSGDKAVSYSLWIKADTLVNTMIVALGENGVYGTAGKTGGIYMGSNGTLYNTVFSNGIQATGVITTGTWIHIVATKIPGGSGITTQTLYVNGVKPTQSNWGTAGTSLSLDDPVITLGASPTLSQYFNGSISNFKLYECALTAEEVKTLYDMGRCDEGHHVVNFSKTRVGIGLGDGEAPRGALDVRGDVITKASIGAKNVTNPFSPVDIRNTVTYNGETGTNFNPETMGAINIRHGPGNDYSMWNITCHNDNDLYFLYNQHTATTNPNWGVAGYLMDNSAQGQLTFTGQHRTFIKDVPFSQASDLEGLIVSSDQNKYIKLSGGIEAGSNAITINESLPVVSLSTTTNDKKCFGVISASEDPENRSDAYGSFVTPFEKEKGDTRVYINSVGEGAIWVVNTNGSLESGDYITTSNVAGYGQKQDDDVLHNYTVAKITMDCDFEPATQPVQQILRSNVVETYYLGNVHHTKTVPHEFVTTVVGADDEWSNVSISPSDVTYAEWSNLEANTQNTYTLTYTQTSNVVYDVKYTLTTTANVTESDPWDNVFIDPPDVTYAEYSNLEANTQNTYTLTFTQTTTDTKTPEEWSALESNTQSLYNKVYYQSVEEEVAPEYPGAVAHTRVTDRIENELDEHGQIQWEDHPTETEKAYKIRFLDANGVETDSANAVHIAAFVGCTYHCG